MKIFPQNQVQKRMIFEKKKCFFLFYTVRYLTGVNLNENH